MIHDKRGSDQIHIEGLEITARLGVSEEERALAQRLIFNITFWPKDDAATLDDDIARTVNYAAVCVEAKNFVEARADRLIETLADALAIHLLAVFEIQRI